VAEFKIGTYVDITAKSFTIDTGASGTAPFAQFQQLSATIGTGKLTFGASVSDLAFLADGSFATGSSVLPLPPRGAPP